MKLNRLGRVVVRVTAGLIAVLLVVLLVWEDGRFLLRAGWEEARILVRRRPIERLVQDSSLPPVVRGKLELVLDARRYAVQVLGLEAGRSFLYYSDVGRDTLVLVLSAAYRDRLESYRWWFPVVGRVPYRGYFDWGAARRAEERLRRRGFDTYLRPATAFSTLGWFDDPLLSTTLAEDSVGLANTVIHELVHNTVFVRDAVEFNESLASFVGGRGAVAFFRERGDSVAAERAEAEWGDERRLAAFWDALAGAVEDAYRRAGSDSVARVAARDSVYRAWRRVLVDSVGPSLRFVSRVWLERVPLDNASLLARRTYATRVDVFEAVWERCGRDVAAVVRLARSAGEGDPYAVLAGGAAACASTR